VRASSPCARSPTPTLPQPPSCPGLPPARVPEGENASHSGMPHRPPRRSDP
jgi:hypothetical protein